MTAQGPDGNGRWWRSTALHREMAYVGGTLYASGGLLVLLTMGLLPFEPYRPAWVTAVGIVALVVGAFYIWSAKRLPMPLWMYSIATSFGAILVTLAVFGGGPRATALYGVLYVFVSTYGFYYYPWPLASWFVVLDAIGFGAALVFHEAPGAVAQWCMIMGTSVIAGGLIGTLGRQVRGLLTVEQANVASLSDLDAWKTTFLQAVSHDLRSPLASMLGLLMVVRDHDAELADEQRHDFVVRSIKAGERLQRLVGDLLDLERIEAGEIQPRLEVVPLHDLVRDCVAALEDGGGRIDLDLQPVTARVEPAKVDRIVTNLVSNAIRHTPDGTRVWVRLEEDGDSVVIVVEDDGPGLPEGVRRTLFDAYGEHEPGLDGSVGLGLHLVRRFTELHGGTVDASDRRGGGTRFEVRLPSQK